MKNHLLATVSLAMLTAASPALAAEDAAPYADKLLGNVGGLRDRLDKHGVAIDLNYKGNGWSNTSGGTKRGEAYNGVATLTLALDNEKSLGIKGNSANISLINTHGGKPNSLVGSTQGVDNIEVTTPTTVLYEAWVQQNFMDDRISALVGVRDLNAEFAVTDMTANFIKPVMQIGQDFAQSGTTGPSVYPVTGGAARLRVAPTPISYIQAAAFDGIPGSTTNARGTHVHVKEKDGALLVAEAGITPWNSEGSEANKFAIGAWTYTKKFTDQVTGNPANSEGVYALSSYQFCKDAKDRTLGAFLRVGGANDDVNQVDLAYEAGFVGNGWVPTRTESEIGLGVAGAHNGDSYITATGEGTKRSETSFELYYRDTVAPGIAVQPDFQYVVNPGTTTGVKNATLLGLRMDVSF